MLPPSTRLIREWPLGANAISVVPRPRPLNSRRRRENVAVGVAAPDQLHRRLEGRRSGPLATDADGWPLKFVR